MDLSRAKKVNNYIEDATDNAAGNLKFDSTQIATFTVPAGKRWFVLGGMSDRDVSSTLTTTVFDVSDKKIDEYQNIAGATGDIHWPELNQIHPSPLGILDAGEYVKFIFGTAQGVGASVSCMVLEIDI